jgi:hypothetical protein
MTDIALRMGEFLVLYDCGQGGLWAIVRADSADQVRQRWPQLEVFDRRPAAMDDRLYVEIRGRGIRGLEATDAVWLASLASAAHSHDHVVTPLGRTGLRYVEGSRSMFVDSEMLARPNGIAVYRESIERWDPPHECDALSESDRARILASIVLALRSQGLEVDVL